MTTYQAKPSEIEPQWFVIDAAAQPLGRLASKIATILRGKNKAIYTPHVDTGDFVVVVNAEQVSLSGDKLNQKMYSRHSGYPGGFRAESYQSIMDRKPELAIEKAVKGMLPKNPLGRKMLSKLKVYAGQKHPHTAQQPTSLSAKSA